MSLNYAEIVDQWYERFRPIFLQRLSVKYPTISLATAEDIYQDTFIAIHHNMAHGRLRPENNWCAYIMSIGFNLATKYLRHAERTDSIDAPSLYGESGQAQLIRQVEESLAEVSVDEMPVYLNPKAHSLLSEELSNSPKTCNSIIRLFYYEGMSMEEIALQVGYKNATTARVKKSQYMRYLSSRVKDSLRRAGLVG